MKSHFQKVELVKAKWIRGLKYKPGKTVTLSRHAAGALIAQGVAKPYIERRVIAELTYETKVMPAPLSKPERLELGKVDAASKTMAKLRGLKGTKGGLKEARRIAETLGVRSGTWRPLLRNCAVALGLVSDGNDGNI